MSKKTKIDITSFSLHINSRSNKSHDVKFILTISKNPEHPLQKHFENYICYVIDEIDVRYPGICPQFILPNYEVKIKSICKNKFWINFLFTDSFFP